MDDVAIETRVNIVRKQTEAALEAFKGKADSTKLEDIIDQSMQQCAQFAS